MAENSPSGPYRAALACYGRERLGAILLRLVPTERGVRPVDLVDAIADRLAEPRTVDAVLEGLDEESRAALALLGLAEGRPWPAAGLALSLRALGFDSEAAVPPLLDSGLVASDEGVDRRTNPADPAVEDPPAARLIPHPEAVGRLRMVLPRGRLPETGPARLVREADGLEPIARLAALWQRVVGAPLRQTQQGTLYKRDRERVEDAPVLAGPIADAIEPLPDMPRLWLELARGVGLLLDRAGTDRLEAAPAAFWSENAVHLPQMLAQRWLTLAAWHELGGFQEPDTAAVLAAPFVRPAALLWLATLAEGRWAALPDLAILLHESAPGWDRPALGLPTPETAPPAKPGARRVREKAPTIGGADWLAAILLGPAYQLGLVRAAEEEPTGRRLVALTPLGHYALGLGPPPPPRPEFDHFLFVQPNFQVIAYRQGLTPARIGELARFLRFDSLGAALELMLDAESVYRGLESGLTTEAMLGELGRFTARPLPGGVAEALRSWAGRRERVTYHAAATLIEFSTPDALDAALAAWDADAGPPPTRIADRLLLVEAEATIPFRRFRLSGSRDYRLPPEPCVEVEPDGIILAIDLNRSDLFVEAELARLADELPDPAKAPGGLPKRRFRVTSGTLARARAGGVGPPGLATWFAERTGGDVPPAIRLLLHAADAKAKPVRAQRSIVVLTPTADLLDGLLQHPATRGYLADRLGPTAAVVVKGSVEGLRRTLAELGLAFEFTGE